MTTWNPRANDLFLKAVELGSVDERREYLDQACGGDVALRAEVESLLDAGARAGDFLESLALDPDATCDRDPTLRPLAEGPGTVIGPYKLLEQIGKGGMGTVYMAQQTEPVKRLVALKVINPGMDSRQVIARFEAERQALALMDHPNIARVFDAGTTETGRPYFVMELVKGVLLTRYCDEHRLTPEQRLKLFIPVCEAIQHAHQKGIIHRDIKPSNVLVALYDGQPVPKVIDFGIAKAAGPQLTEKTLVTGFGAVVGTLEYMSPEQAELNQLDIDTRSDIYSLGVLLYELLTGTTPLDPKRLKDAAMLEMLRVIREEEPPRPSTRLSTMEDTATVASNRGVEPKKLSGLVRGELDWIVMKALEKDRSRRYETANGLAMDVQRYLADETVQACPPSAWYRFRKFTRRNRVAIGLASVVATALLVLLAGLAIGVALLGRANTLLKLQVEETRRQRRLADENYRQARRAVDDYFTQVSESTLLRSPLPGLQPLRRELLETALKYYQAFVAEHADDPALWVELADAYSRVGDIRREIGVIAEAIRAYQSARDLWEKLAHDNPSERRFQSQLARCLRQIAFWQVSYANQPDEGFRVLHQAQNIYEKLIRAAPDDAELQSGLALTYDRLGTSYVETSQAAKALAFHRKALTIWQRLAVSDRKLRRDLAASAINIGYCHTLAGQASQALESLETAREILAQLSSENPTDINLLSELRRLYINIGYVHQSVAGKYPEALDAYQQSRQILERLARDHPAVADFQLLKAGIYVQISEVFQTTEQFEKAKELLPQAQQILEQVVATDPENSRARQYCGRCYANSGWTELGLGHPQAALAYSRKAQTIAEGLLRGDADELEYVWDLGLSHALAAEAYQATGDMADAMQSYQKAIAVLKRTSESSHRNFKPLLNDLVGWYAGLGHCQQAAGQRTEAEGSYQHALDIVQKYFAGASAGTTVRNSCEALISLAEVQIDSGKLDEGRHSLLRALGLIEKLPELNNHDQYNLARLRSQWSRTIGSDRATLIQKEHTERKAHMDQAMHALRKALTAGYPKLARLKRDPSLDPLRSREDFQELLSEQEKRELEMRSPGPAVKPRQD
jgi:serine/threonine protein kinase/tetratricopeptide (TPR) repeat protein